MTKINKVTVLGTGVLGSQIAFQTAFKGFEVVAFDIDDSALTAANERLDALVSTYTDEVSEASGGRAAEAIERITMTSDLETAVSDADLVIEAVPEDLSIKNELYGKLDAFAPDHTIFATNSSTLLPSDMVQSTGRPEKFLALHFANRIWVHNSAEVMKTDRTAQETYETVVAFAENIGMVPIELKKEKAGYVTDSLLKPFLIAGLSLFVDGYAEPEMIDRAWRLATGAPLGPLEIIDEVGLMTPYNVAKQSGPEGERLADFLKTNYIDKGKLGQASGEGIYKYPK
ncbi:3-hydroxyacyl-CoA dehydrogenase [Dietzia alimentaria]|uniref:3-hydroxyacyl-CoA dehydrogenase n=1 Tax=Dietzia alimentaria TaxID=665550 RepID=UPI00029AD84B|nr:3-hydroxyacyl-CoA dehydrogenase [Dietzia alimentaria]